MWTPSRITRGENMDWPRLNRARDALTVLLRSWMLIVGVALICGLGALGWCLLKTPVYEATVTLYVTSGNNEQPSSAYEDAMGSQQRVASYATLVFSESVLAPAVRSSGLNMSTQQARDAVTALPIRSTVLFTVGAKDPNPEVARRLANAVSDSIIDTVAKLDAPTGGGAPTSRLTALDSATVAPRPVFPNTLATVLAATLLGLFLGVAAALGRERFNNTVRDVGDAEAAAGSPVLAQVPEDQVLRTSRIVDFPASPGASAEAFRQIRGALLRAGTNGRIFAVTSPRTSDGKSAVALNIAESFEESGLSAVVVDGNLRHPVIATRTGGSDHLGVTDVVAGRLPLAESLQTCADSGLSILGSGVLKKINPADLLASAAFGNLLDELAKKFDVVVVDTGALLDGGDSRELMKWVDGVVLVLRPSKTKLSDVYDCASQLSVLGAKLVGTVLNGVGDGRRHQKPRRRRAAETVSERSDSTAS